MSRGFRPDDSSLSAFAKLFVMGIVGGPGAWATLPAVLVGYFGSPGGKRRWIEESLKQVTTRDYPRLPEIHNIEESLKQVTPQLTRSSRLDPVDEIQPSRSSRQPS